MSLLKICLRASAAWPSRLHSRDLITEELMDVPWKVPCLSCRYSLLFVRRANYHAAMERRQGFKFELRPTGEQQRQMRRFAGCARYVYNKGLSLQQQCYQNHETKLTRFQLDKLLVPWKRETPWLAEAPSHALQQAIVDLDRAFGISSRSEQTSRSFTRKGTAGSYRESDPKCVTLDQPNSRIRLPKIGWVRYRNSREVLGADKECHGQRIVWQVVVSISTLREVEQPQHPSTSTVGMDWGVTNFVTLSNGEVVDQCQPLKKFLTKLAKLQRRMAWKIRSSRRIGAKRKPV